MKIKIQYDGHVSMTAASVHLGEFSLERLIAKTLNVAEGSYKDINAEVEIVINCKPEAPVVMIEGDDEC